MIEITHQQAQRLLRSHLDVRLPNEQWMTLQAHLETCETCRQYNEQLTGLEKNLKRSLRAGWGSAHGPQEDTGERVLAGLQGRARMRKRLLAASAAAALILILVWLGGPAAILGRLAGANGSPVSKSGVPATGITPTPEPTEIVYQPTVQPGEFSEVIAYQGRMDGQPNGNDEIYLLNPGSASANLTNNPAQDTDPAWSPDGEWLAFLSDRNKKTEVFVTNISGTRVVQLTAEPGVAWYGPISWSPDGRWITLEGVRTQQGDQSWIYMVPLNGTGPRTLAGSRGGDSPKFSPSGIQIAFRFVSGDFEGIIVQNLENGGQVLTRWRENPLAPSPAAGSAFDWSPDGSGLAFLSAMPNLMASADQPESDAPPPSGDPGSQVIAVRPTYRRSEPFTFLDNHYPIDNSRWPGAFRGVTWAPGGNVVYLEDLDDARANDQPGTQPQGCWTLQVSGIDFNRQPGQEPSRQTSFGGLCVEGGVSRASWTADGRWIVVQGRLPFENRPSIYALRVPGGVERARRFPRATATPASASAGDSAAPKQPGLPGEAVTGTILRLSDDHWAGSLPSPRPRRGAFGYYLDIEPQPVKEPGASLTPSNLSQGIARGHITYVVPNRNISVVASANPDGTGGRVLLATPGLNRCPTWSPDGNAVALVQASLPDSNSYLGSGDQWLFGGAYSATGKGTSSSAINGSSNGAAVQNIFVLNPTTGGVRKASRVETIPVSGIQPDRVSYGCPAWSPKGPSSEASVAALVSDGQKTFLAVLPAGLPGPAAEDDPQPEPRYLAVTDPDWSKTPVWSPDGETIYLLRSAAGGSPGITVVTVPGDPQSPLTSASHPGAWRTGNVPELAILPDGEAIVQLEMNGTRGSAHLHGITFSTTGGVNETGPAVYLENTQNKLPNPGERLESGSLTWLYDSTFSVILHGGPQNVIKTRFYLYNMKNDSVQAVAAVEDKVNSAAWSPDGRWLVFSAESGLWGVDIRAALQGKAGPVWISPQPVQDLDWK